MKHSIDFLVISVALVCTFTGESAAKQGNESDPVRFIAVDVYLDSAEPVAAWQFEMNENGGRMTVVGVENGSSQAFSEAPYFDREAVELGNADRIIVADYSLDAEDSLPIGRIRLATIHIMLAGSGSPEFQLNLIAAASADGKPVNASITMERTTGR